MFDRIGICMAGFTRSLHPLHDASACKKSGGQKPAAMVHYECSLRGNRTIHNVIVVVVIEYTVKVKRLVNQCLHFRRHLAFW